MPRSRPLAPSRALPATVADLEERRIVKRKSSIVDEADDVLSAIIEDDEWRASRGLEPDDAVHGNLIIDDVKATDLFKAKAIELHKSILRSVKLDKVMAAMHSAERRLNIGKKQRKRAAE